MPQKVHLPDGRIVHFPDSMTPEQITSVIETELLPAQQAQAAPAEEKSIGGFLGNVASSAGRFAKDTVVGIPSVLGTIAKMQRAFFDPRATAELAEGGKQIMQAIPGMVADRYGSLEKAGNTLYEDPVGVLADASALSGLGAGATAAKAPGMAAKFRAVERAANPVRAAKPIATATEYGTAAAMRPLLSPAKATVRQSRAPLEIERTALKEGAVTQRGAVRKLKAATAKTDAAAAEAKAAGVTVPREKLAQMPQTLDDVEYMTPNVRELDELASLEGETLATLRAEVDPTEVLKRRRSLDKTTNAAYRAEEKQGRALSVRDKGQIELGNNMREALREIAPSVYKSDDQARRLAQVAQAIEDANLRPKTYPMSAALAGASGGYLAGMPAAAALGGAIGIGRTFPQIPLALGSIPVRGTALAAEAAGNPVASRGALLAALLERLNGDQ